MDFKVKQLQEIMKGLGLIGRSKATNKDAMVKLIGQEDLAFIENSMKMDDSTLGAAITKCRQQKNGEKDVVRTLNSVLNKDQAGKIQGMSVPMSKAFDAYIPQVKELDGYKSRSLSKATLTIQQFIVKDVDHVPKVTSGELRLQDSPLFAAIRKHGSMQTLSNMQQIINVELHSKTVAKLVLRNGLFIDMNTKKVYVAKKVVTKKSDDGKIIESKWVFHAINGGEIYSIEEFGELREKSNIVKFSVLGSSPSMIRKLQVYLISSSINGFELLDDLTGGYFGRHNGCKMTKKKAIKVASRVLQSSAGQKDVGEVDCYAIIGDKLSLTVIPKSGDGQCYLLDTHMQKLFNRTTGLGFTIDEIEGLAMQCRPFYSLAKVLGHCVSESYIWENIRKYGKDAVVRVEPGTDIFNGDFDNKVVIVGSGTPQVLIDHDGLKGAFNTALRQSMTVLDIAQLSEASLNIQTLQKFCGHEEFGPYVNKLIDKLVDETIEEFSNTAAGRVSIADCLFIENFISKVNPAFCNKDYVFRENKIRKIAESLTRKANGMNIPIEGNFVRLVCDPVRDFYAYGILRMDEFYCNGINKEKTALVKFPSNGQFEVLIAKRVSYREACRRIDKLFRKGELTGQQAKVLRRRFSKMSKGVMSVSGDYNLKDFLAGLDFDFDGAMAILDQAIIRMIEESGRKLIVHIDPDDESTEEEKEEKELIFCFENMGQIIEGFFLSDSASVGEVVNMGDRVLALRFQTALKKKELMKQMLEIDSEGTEEYDNLHERWSYVKLSSLKKNKRSKLIVRPSAISIKLKKCDASCKNGHHVQLRGSEYKHIHVKTSVADKYIAKMKVCRLSEHAVDKMCCDTNGFVRMYCERTIDSPKNDDKVKVKVKAKFKIKTHIRKEVVFSIEKGLKFDYEDPRVTDDVYKNALSCPISESREHFYSEIQKMIVRLPEYDGLGDDVIECLSDVFTSDRYKNLIASLSVAREMYFTAISIESKEEKAEALKVLRNQVRRFLYNSATVKSLYGQDATVADPSTVGYVAKALSLLDENGKLNPKGNNKFASALFPEEYALAIAAYLTDGGEYLMVEEPVRGTDFVPFEEVEFVNGIPVGKRGMALNKFTAKMRMVKKGGKWYATLLASEIIKAKIKKDMGAYSDKIFVRKAGTKQQCLELKGDLIVCDVVRLNLVSTFLSFDAENGKECRFFTSSNSDNKLVPVMNKLMYGNKDYFAVRHSMLAETKVNKSVCNYAAILERIDAE